MAGPEQAPESAEAQFDLGVALARNGELDAAAAAYRRAIALRPDHVQAHLNLGGVLRRQGRLDEAVAAYRQALVHRPDYPMAFNNLGNALRAQGRLQEAAQSYRRAIALQPDYAEAHHHLGVVLRDLGELGAAVAAYRRAVVLRPDYAEAHNNLGVALADRGDLDAAVASYRRALALKPDHAKAHYNLGLALQHQGALDAAAESYRLTLALKPDHAGAHYNLALQTQADGSPQAEAAFAALSVQAEDLDHFEPDERSLLLFALGKALEDRGDHDRAFAALAQANALQRASLTFDIAAYERRAAEIAQVFDTALFERLAGAALTSERPIFVVGMARSGTTLVEQILSAHPAVQGAGETATLAKLVEQVDGAAYPAWARTMTAVGARGLAQAYLDALPAAGPGETRVTDKTLSNFEHLGLIQLCLPNAAIIHCRRDPRDVGLSCFANRFSQGQDHTYDLAELGRYWRAYDRLMAHWRAVLPPGRMLDVPYEAVVEDVEGWARRLVAHCGLAWDDACLRFHESGRAVRTGSFAQVRRPIYADSVGRWRRFAGHLGPLLEALGAPWADAD